MFKYCAGGIFLIFCRNDMIYHIRTLFGRYFSFINNFTLTLVIYNEPIIYELIKIGFICIDISNIFCHEQICTIEYFTPNYFSAKGIIFLFT